MNDDTNDGIKRFRSPPYPAMNLAKAVERAGELYAKAMHHAVGLPVLADAWSYGAKSSGLSATAAALQLFGLLNGQGTGPKRRFQLTDVALRIIKDADPASEKRVAALKTAAMAPNVYADLWRTYGSASDVSDVVIRNFLTLDRSEAGKAPYGDAAANEIIKSYKETLVFAGIRDDASIQSPSDGDEIDDPGANQDLSSLDDFVRNITRVPAPQPPPPPSPPTPPPPPPPPPGDDLTRSTIRGGERELVSGLLSKEATFRVLVTGQVGVKEIDRLIRKLELDKEIIADADDA